jgi:predicted nucleic acid-binding protein
LKSLVFADTSALLKLYLPEIGSKWFQNFIVGKQLVVSELVLLEATLSLRRRYTEGTLTEIEALDLIDKINFDLTNYTVYPIGGAIHAEEVKLLAFSLPTTARIRTLDAVHLTTASKAFEAVNAMTPPVPFVFVSADVQLLRIAQGLKIPGENPENHP